VLVRRCQDEVTRIGGLDLVPAEWLHLTRQIVGFAAEIGDADRKGTKARTTDHVSRHTQGKTQLQKVRFHSKAAPAAPRAPSRP
jgi:hypothetical protein